MKELAIVIPVYNEENNIRKVLKDWKNILDKNKFDLIIVNDGSTDKTKKIITSLKYKNLHLINKANSGHGDALVAGYTYACKKKYSFIFQVDSDNQFASSDFNKLWKLKNKNFDIILGYRKNRKDAKLRKILSKILKYIILLFFKKLPIDANTPFRLINLVFLSKFLKTIKKNCLVPNLLMTILSTKTYWLPVKHYSRLSGQINWPIYKLFKFGVMLLFEIISWKNRVKISKNI